MKFVAPQNAQDVRFGVAQPGANALNGDAQSNRTNVDKFIQGTTCKIIDDINVNRITSTCGDRT